MEITERHIKMISPEGFSELWLQEIQTAETYEIAFNILNQEYQRVFGKARYASYDSFRISRLERLRKKLGETEKV